MKHLDKLLDLCGLCKSRFFILLEPRWSQPFEILHELDFVFAKTLTYCTQSLYSVESKIKP